MQNKERPGKQKYMVLVIYDIIDNRRRQRLAKLLKGYGYRIQKSAFECLLTNGKYLKLVDEIEKLKEDDDLIKVYKLHSDVEIRTYGDMKRVEEDEIIFI